MNRTASIRIKGIDIVFLKENAAHILLFFLLVISILCGACALHRPSVFSCTEALFKEYINVRASGKFLFAFGVSLLNSLRALAIIYLAGTSAIGLVLSPVLVFLAGFNYGAVSGYVYMTYGLSGIVFNLFVFLLPSIVLLFALLLQAKEAVNFSCRLANSLIKDKRPVNLYRDFRTYCKFSLLLLLPTIVSSAIDVLLYNLFRTYFTF